MYRTFTVSIHMIEIYIIIYISYIHTYLQWFVQIFLILNKTILCNDAGRYFNTNMKQTRNLKDAV